MYYLSLESGLILTDYPDATGYSEMIEDAYLYATLEEVNDAIARFNELAIMDGYRAGWDKVFLNEK